MNQSEFFTSKFFENNRRELLRRSKAQLIVIPAHQTMQRNLDNNYPFRQESNFWYLTGINLADCILVLSATETFIIRPHRDWVEDAFDGAIDPDELTKISGIATIMPERLGWQRLGELIKKHKTIGVLRPMQRRYFSMAMNPARAQLIAKMRRRRKGLVIEDLRLPLSQMRMIKQPEELEALQKAIDITNDTLIEIFKPGWAKRYKTEYELDADITAGFRRRGASGHGFTPIIANGKKTCTIHPIDNSSPLQNGNLLLLDLGAEIHNYTADVARTVCIGQKMSPRQKEVFEAVQDANNYALSLLKPGQNYMKYEKKVEEHVGKKLVELGVIKTPSRKNIRKYFPHRTSHSLGLDPHDPADYSGDLQENMVITVEPGIYIPEEGIGVRIEDDVLITKTGHKVLSATLPVML